MSTLEQNSQTILAPSRVIANFISTWPPETVRDYLWVIFRFAILGQLEEGKDLTVEEVSKLFDQLNELVAALNQLPAGAKWSITSPEGDTHA